MEQQRGHMCDDVTYVYDDVTYVYDDVTHTGNEWSSNGGDRGHYQSCSARQGRMCSLLNVFSIECVVYRMCSR
jgi:hypothetical protein